MKKHAYHIVLPVGKSKGSKMINWASAETHKASKPRQKRREKCGRTWILTELTDRSSLERPKLMPKVVWFLFCLLLRHLTL